MGRSWYWGHGSGVMMTWLGWMRQRLTGTLATAVLFLLETFLRRRWP
jgi:hypothetical protein